MKKILIALVAVFAMVTLLNAQEAQKEQKKSTNEYIADLSGNDENNIIRAADWLGKEEEEKALPQLKKLIKDDSRYRVRLHAAMALGYIGEKKSVDNLEDQLLIEPNADVRYTIFLSLTRIGLTERKHVEALKKAQEAETDPIIKDYMDKIIEKYSKK